MGYELAETALCLEQRSVEVVEQALFSINQTSLSQAVFEARFTEASSPCLKVWKLRKPRLSVIHTLTSVENEGGVGLRTSEDGSLAFEHVSEFFYCKPIEQREPSLGVLSDFKYFLLAIDVRLNELASLKVR